MKRIEKNIIYFGCGIMLISLFGCMTKIPPKQENPYFGYVHCKSIENDKKVNSSKIAAQIERYKKEIAKSELNLRRASRPSKSDEKVESWKRYSKKLKAPIRIFEQQWKGSANGLKKKKMATLVEYWGRNKRRLEFRGNEVLKSWSDELIDAEMLHARKYEARAKLLRNQINNFKQLLNYEKAIGLLGELENYENIGSYEDKLRDEAAKYWITTIENGRQEAEDFSSDLQEDTLTDLYGKTKKYEKLCARRPRDFREVRQNTVDDLGNNWRRQIEDLGEKKQYWGAYQFALKRVNTFRNNENYGEGYWLILRNSIDSGYNTILPVAINHFADKAGEKLGQDLYGAAFIYCCMAIEMYDFCRFSDFDAESEAQGWNDNVTSLSDVLEREIKDQLSRRLIIYDFEYDKLRIASKVRDICMGKYKEGNTFAWGLDVLKDIELATDKSLSPLVSSKDYVVTWSRADYRVKELRDRKLGSEIFKRKTDRIALIDNPNRKKKASPWYKYKQVKAQAVDWYQKEELERRNTVSFDVLVSCRHNDVNIKLFKRSGDLQSLINEKCIIKVREYGPEMRNQGVLYHAPDKADRQIKIDPTPPSRTPEPPSEKEIENQIKGAIPKLLDKELEVLIARYPVDLLAESLAKLDSMSISSDEHSNTMGEVLLYVSKLSEISAAKRPEADRGYIWLHRRNQINENLKLWCDTRWSQNDKVVLRELSDLWSKCIMIDSELDGE